MNHINFQKHDNEDDKGMVNQNRNEKDHKMIKYLKVRRDINFSMDGNGFFRQVFENTISVALGYGIILNERVRVNPCFTGGLTKIGFYPLDRI